MRLKRLYRAQCPKALIQAVHKEFVPDPTPLREPPTSERPNDAAEGNTHLQELVRASAAKVIKSSMGDIVTPEQDTTIK